MTSLIHTLSDGIELTIEVKRRAKKNLIIRPIGTHTVSTPVRRRPQPLAARQ